MRDYERLTTRQMDRRRGGATREQLFDAAVAARRVLYFVPRCGAGERFHCGFFATKVLRASHASNPFAKAEVCDGCASYPGAGDFVDAHSATYVRKLIEALRAVGVEPFVALDDPWPPPEPYVRGG
jgi:hypothetical protein